MYDLIKNNNDNISRITDIDNKKFPVVYLNGEKDHGKSLLGRSGNLIFTKVDDESTKMHKENNSIKLNSKVTYLGKEYKVSSKNDDNVVLTPLENSNNEVIYTKDYHLLKSTKKPNLEKNMTYMLIDINDKKKYIFVVIETEYFKKYIFFPVVNEVYDCKHPFITIVNCELQTYYILSKAHYHTGEFKAKLSGNIIESNELGKILRNYLNIPIGKININIMSQGLKYRSINENIKSMYTIDSIEFDKKTYSYKFYLTKGREYQLYCDKYTTDYSLNSFIENDLEKNIKTQSKKSMYEIGEYVKFKKNPNVNTSVLNGIYAIKEIILPKNSNDSVKYKLKSTNNERNKELNSLEVNEILLKKINDTYTFEKGFRNIGFGLGSPLYRFGKHAANTVSPLLSSLVEYSFHPGDIIRTKNNKNKGRILIVDEYYPISKKIKASLAVQSTDGSYSRGNKLKASILAKNYKKVEIKKEEINKKPLKIDNGNIVTILGNKSGKKYKAVKEGHEGLLRQGKKTYRLKSLNSNIRKNIYHDTIVSERFLELHQKKNKPEKGFFSHISNSIRKLSQKSNTAKKTNSVINAPSNPLISIPKNIQSNHYTKKNPKNIARKIIDMMQPKLITTHNRKPRLELTSRIGSSFQHINDTEANIINDHNDFNSPPHEHKHTHKSQTRFISNEASPLRYSDHNLNTLITNNAIEESNEHMNLGELSSLSTKTQKIGNSSEQTVKKNLWAKVLNSSKAVKRMKPTYQSVKSTESKPQQETVSHAILTNKFPQEKQHKTISSTLEKLKETQKKRAQKKENQKFTIGSLFTKLRGK